MMTAVAIRPEKLKDNIAAALGAKVHQITVALDEVALVVSAADYLDAMRLLRDCAERTREEPAGPGRDFHRQMKELDEFLSFGVKVADTVISMKHASALQWAMRLLG